MPDPIVWGMLPKSQTDSQTLADYITEQFEDHNDDPDAHADTGQALDVHRTGIILDHPAGCIVTDKLVAGCVTSDKITSDQIVSKDIRTAEDVGVGVDGVKMTEDGIEMWEGGERKVNIPPSGLPYFKGVLLGTRIYDLRFTLHLITPKTSGFSGSATAFDHAGYFEFATGATTNTFYDFNLAGDEYDQWFADVNKNPMFEVQGLFSRNTNIEGYIGFLGEPLDSGFHFKVVNNTVYATYVNSSVVEVATSLSGIAPNVRHKWRIEVTTGTKIEWFIDDVLVHSITWATFLTSNGTDSNPSYMWIKKTNATLAYFSGSYFHYEQDY